MASEASLGATGTGSTVYVYPNVLNRVLGVVVALSFVAVAACVFGDYQIGTRMAGPTNLSLSLIGLTFFAPLFDQANNVRMWAGHLEEPYTLKKVVANLMQAPLYPVTLDIFRAGVEFKEFKSGDTLSCGPMAMRTAPRWMKRMKWA